MALVEKTIALSAFEQAALAKQSNLNFIQYLPLFVVRWFVLKNIEKFRIPEGLVLPVMPECAHPLENTRHELPGAPKPIGITVYARKDLSDGKKPLFFYIHGGGFMGGDFIMNEGLLRLVADQTGCIAAAVNYNVSPEVRHPVPLTECAAALDYVLSNYPCDDRCIFICGDSAGGNLTAALTLKRIDDGKTAPRGQIMLYPVTDMDKVDSESYRIKGHAYAGMGKGIRLSRTVYLPDKASRRSPYVSPMCADFKAPQPDALLLVAEIDGLRDDGIEYGKKLEAAGGYSRTVLYQGAYHSFINDLRRSAIADDAAEEILTFIKDRIGG